jgi:peptidoglycan/LPS O-acetylase OafA/YrhL
MIERLLTGLRRVTSTGHYDPRLDGLRFLAILPVLVFHDFLRGERVVAAAKPLTAHEQWMSALVPQGYAGVMLFFFISGFIITYPFLRAKAQDRPIPSVRAFYVRRLLRLGPAYVIALTVCFLGLQLSGYAPADAPKFNAVSTPLPLSYLASLIYQHNMIIGASSRILPPIWTLEIEFQFYLFAPFLLAWYVRANAVVRRIAMLAGIGAGIALVSLPWLPDLLGARLSLSVLGHLHFFLAGILASDVMFARKPAFRPWGDPLCAVGFVTLLASSVIAGSDTAHIMLREGGMLVGVLAIYAGSMLGERASRFLSAAPIAVIGGACYSIYLVHLPVIQVWSELVKRLVGPDNLTQSWMLMLPAIPAAVAAGLVFFALVERPTMKPDWPARLASGLRRRLAEAAARRSARS